MSAIEQALERLYGASLMELLWNPDAREYVLRTSAQTFLLTEETGAAISKAIRAHQLARAGNRR